MYEMKGALLCPQPVRAIPLVTGTPVEVIHDLVHRLSTVGQECEPVPEVLGTGPVE
jgi:hypothetical protein